MSVFEVQSISFACLIIPSDEDHKFYFTALASGLPYLEPSMKEDGNFTAGVNFAVAGSTALPKEVLEAKDITNPISNSSLSVQLDWMSSHFASICHTKEGLQNNLYQPGTYS